jgi:hypothetical protein
MKQLVIASGPAGSQLVSGDPDNPVEVLIQNVDPSNTLYLGSDPGVNVTNPLENVPLSPGQSAVANGSNDVYGIAASGQTVQVNIFVGVVSFFQPPNLASLGGISIYTTATAPTGNIPLNSLWFAPDGSIRVWNGVTWNVQSFSGQEILQAQTVYAAQLAAGIVYAGIVNGTLISGASLQSTGTGLDYSSYNGTPAANNLILSFAKAGGTDSFGNVYLAGFTCYFKGSSQWTAMSIQPTATGCQVAWYYSSGLTETGWTSAGGLMVTPTATTPQATLQLGVAPSTPSGTAGQGLLYALGGTNLGQVTGAGLNLVFSCIQPVIPTLSTVTAASATSLATGPAFPANDPANQSTYELEIWAAGTWGSTGEILNLQGQLGGVNICPVVQIGAAAIATGTAFRLHARVVTKLAASPGASATWYGGIDGGINITGAALLPGTAAQNTIPFTSSDASPTAVPSNVAQAITLQAWWASTTGASTITAVFGHLKRTL